MSKFSVPRLFYNILNMMLCETEIEAIFCYGEQSEQCTIPFCAMIRAQNGQTGIKQLLGLVY